MRIPLWGIPSLDLGEVPFSRRPVECRTSNGTPFTKWIAYGMPHLGKYKWVKEIVFFLYESEEDARRGESSGGTGFLVGVPSRRWGHHYVHVHGVTNWHVACQGAPVIRVNRRDGKPEIFDFGPDQWVFEPAGPDLAISPLLNLNVTDHIASSIGIENILTDEVERKIDFDAAEDVFMIGRFVDYDGAEANEPAARFGHVSIKSANVKQETGYSGRSIVLDMHSRTGFSGSPVFAYRTPGSGFPDEGQHLTGSMLYILGIHWGQFPELWELGKPNKTAPTMARKKDVVKDGEYVRGLSGMTLVVPGQAINDLIMNNKELRAMREAAEIDMQKRIDEHKAKNPMAERPMTAWYGADISKLSPERQKELKELLNRSGGPSAERAVRSDDSSATNENPQHREDFTSLLGEAARKPKQDG